MAILLTAGESLQNSAFQPTDADWPMNMWSHPLPQLVFGTHHHSFISF